MDRCRCCLVILERSSLEDEKSNLLASEELASKLRTCCSLTVSSNDEYPKHLCNECLEQLNGYYDFYQKCHNSIKRFKSILKTTDTLIMLLDDEAQDYDLDQLSKDAENQIQAFDLDIKTTNMVKNRKQTRKRSKMVLPEIPIKEERSKSLAEEEQASEPASACLDAVPFCDNENISFVEKEYTIENISEVPKLEELSPFMRDIFDDESCQDEIEVEFQEFPPKLQKENKQIPKDKGSSTSFKCDKCHRRFLQKHRLVGHLRKHEGLIPYPCPTEECERGFYCYNAFKTHLKEHEGEINFYKCDIEGCDRIYRHKPTLVMHMRKYHKKGPELKNHVCEICGKVFKSTAVLNDHHYTHRDKSELPFACELEDCARRFTNKEKLKIHMMRHAGIKNFECPFCGMKKTTKNELKVHINYHTLERTWSCQYCPKVCNSAGNLKMHVRTVHERAKDYACSFCDRTFAKADTRKYHEMTHTGEKPHSCEQCGKRFTQPAALRTHRKIHLRNNQSPDEPESPVKMNEDMYSGVDMPATETNPEAESVVTITLPVKKPSLSKKKEHLVQDNHQQTSLESNLKELLSLD